MNATQLQEAQTLRYRLHIAREQVGAVLSGLAEGGYTPCEESLSGDHAVYVFLIRQPDDFYIVVHNLLRGCAILSCEIDR